MSFKIRQVINWLIIQVLPAVFMIAILTVGYIIGQTLYRFQAEPGTGLLTALVCWLGITAIALFFTYELGVLMKDKKWSDLLMKKKPNHTKVSGINPGTMYDEEEWT